METIRRPADFQRVYDKGRVVRAAALRLCYYYRNDSDSSRVAFVASKRVGGAVQRNRVKRLLREAWRHLDKPDTGWDFIIIPGPRVLQMPLSEIESTITLLMRRSRKQVEGQ